MRDIRNIKLHEYLVNYQTKLLKIASEARFYIEFPAVFCKIVCYLRQFELTRGGKIFVQVNSYTFGLYLWMKS